MSLDTKELQKKQDELEKRRSEYVSKDYYQLEDNKENKLRILPRSLKYFSKEGDNDFAVRYFAHYNVFKEDGFRLILCNKTFDKKCPICDEVSKMTDKSAAGKLRARERFAYNVFDLKDGKIKIFESGPKIYEDILKYVLNPEWGDLFGIKEGRSITIEKISAEKSGTGWAQYNVMPSPHQTDVTDVLPDGWDEEIDKLADKIPNGFSDEDFIYLVECLKSGAAPTKRDNEVRQAVVMERAQQVDQGAVKTEAPVVRKETIGQQPQPIKKEEVKGAFTVPPELVVCYGKQYKPREQKCKTCTIKDNCRIEFLKV